MSRPKITRRSFVEATVATALLNGKVIESRAGDERDDAKYRLYWGDLHNHCAVGYARGSLRHTIDNAQGHLDFFAFTGHAAWHDMPVMPENRHMKWVNGFRVHTDHWPTTRAMIRAANNDRFVALLGYEWHSSRFGDYCLIFPEDQPQLYLPDHVDKLLDFAAAKRALAIPHHVAYKRGWRGANFDHFRPDVSPVVEIFSEHGCSEDLAAPFPYIRHSMGGRSTENTIRRQLERGLRFGFVASSDSHRGYPGAYGEGVVGVWARELTAASLIEAVRAGRTYAATGDRIALDVTLNERPMGTQMAFVPDRQFDVHVRGEDAVASVELLRNGRVIHRHFPGDTAPKAAELPGRVKCRIQYGWGPWAALDLGHTCQWNVTIRIANGRFLRATPCFQSGPFEESLRDELGVLSPHEIHLRSYTSRVKCFAEDPTKAIVCEIEGAPDAVLSVQLNRPVKQEIQASLAQLTDDNLVSFTGGFTAESLIVHPLISPAAYDVSVRYHDRRKAGGGSDWYYVRVTEENGHMAWSSPMWVGERA